MHRGASACSHDRVDTLIVRIFVWRTPPLLAPAPYASLSSHTMPITTDTTVG